MTDLPQSLLWLKSEARLRLKRLAEQHLRERMRSEEEAWSGLVAAARRDLPAAACDAIDWEQSSEGFTPWRSDWRLQMVWRGHWPILTRWRRTEQGWQQAPFEGLDLEPPIDGHGGEPGWYVVLRYLHDADLLDAVQCVGLGAALVAAEHEQPASTAGS